ncbi:MAG: hypothetical protein R3Y13_04195 [bacterium]
MKNIIRNLFMIFVIVFTVLDVNASIYNLGDTASISRASSSFSVSGLDVYTFKTSDVYTQTYNRKYSAYKYTTTINGSTYSAFCLDPHKYGYHNATHTIVGVYEEREIAVNSKDVLLYDKAIKAMFDYADANKGSLSANEFYHAQLMALRTMNFNFGYYSIDSSIISSEQYLIGTYTNLAVYWNTEVYSELSAQVNANYQNSTNSTNSIIKTSYLPINGNYYIINVGSSVGTAAQVYTLAQNMYKAGLEATLVEVEEDSQGTADLEIYESEEKREGNTVTKYITLTAKDFEGNGKIEEFNAEFTGSNITTKCSIKYADGTTNEFASCSDIEGISIDNGDVLTVEVISELLEDDFCDMESYKLTFKISDDSLTSEEGENAYDIDRNVYILYTSTTYTDSNGNIYVPQRFIFSDKGKYDDNYNDEDPDDNTKTYVMTGDITACAKSCDTFVSIPTDCLDFEDGLMDYYVGSVSTDKNVGQCIIDNVDDNGNSYTASSCNYDIDGEEVSNGMELVDSNPYCTVSCVENYDKIVFPGIQNVDSGRYFQVSATVSGNKSCYTSTIDYDKFVQDITAAQKAMVDAYNEYQSSVKAEVTTVENSTCTTGNAYLGLENTYTHQEVSVNSKGESTLTTSQETVNSGSTTSCSGNTVEELEGLRLETIEASAVKVNKAQDSFNEILANLVGCTAGVSVSNPTNSTTMTGWNMLFALDATIEYDYGMNLDGDYVDDYMNMAGLKTDGNNFMVPNSDYDYNDYTVDFEYCSEFNEDGECVEISENDKFSNKDFVYCAADRCEIITIENLPTENISSVKGSIDKEVEYKTPDVFYVAFPSGEVIYSNDPSVTEKEDDIQVSLIPGLPVALSTEKGVYSFTFKIENLGEYYDTCEAGRISEIAKDTVDEENNLSGFENEYICYYTPNCPDCEIETDIEVEENDCKTCLVDGTFQMYFRTISTNVSSDTEYSTGKYESFNPNDRDLGYNWDTDTDYGIVTDKAKATLEEIYSLGNGIYSEDPVLSVTLTPAIAGEIKEDNGNRSSYADDTLTCYDYGDGDNKLENIFCYSDLLDVWSEKYSNNFEFSNRTGNINADVGTTGNTYWTAFTVSVNTDYYFGGPAWK